MEAKGRRPIGREPGIKKKLGEMCRHIYPENIERIRKRTDKFINDYKISPQTIANGTGRSRSSITMFLRKQYPTPEAGLAQAIEGFINKHEEKLRETKDDVKLPPGTNFVKTAAMLRTLHILNFCMENRELGIVYGPAGVGKTTALEEFFKINKDNGSYLITVTPFVTSKIIILEISESLGIGFTSSGATLNRVFKQLAMHIRKNPVFLVFDEADLLSVSALKALKALYDECNRGARPGKKGSLGMVLCGISKLFETMTKGGAFQNNDLAQLYGRVVMAVCLPKPSRDEVEEIARLYVNDLPEDAIKVLYEEASIHGLRRIIKILPGAIKVAEENKTKVSAKVIQAVSNAYMMTA